MTLQSQLESRLAALGGGSALVTVESPPQTIFCDLADHNALAVSLNTMALRTSELANASPADLKRIGEFLAARLTYLMEPISPVELDEEACVVQMRSNPPQRDDDGRSYYELLVRRGGEISLARYRKENGAARRPVAANLTREVLLRLAGDFIAVVNER
jgi:hypothetical protein